MKWLYASCFTMIMMSAIGCVSERVRRELTLTPEQVIAEVNVRARAITTIKGDGTITVESQEGSNSSSFDVFLKKPDSVRVEFHGPFGLQIGSLSLTKEKFVFYDRRENVAIVGTPNGRTLQSLFNLNMDYQEIVDVFTGDFFLKNQTDSMSKFSIQGNGYVIHYQRRDEGVEYEIDGTDFFVSGFRLLDSEGKSQLYAMAQRPIETNSFAMPSLLRVVFPEERRSVTIVYDNIELNTPVRCSFTLPDNVQVISR